MALSVRPRDHTENPCPRFEIHHYYCPCFAPCLRAFGAPRHMIQSCRVHSRRSSPRSANLRTISGWGQLRHSELTRAASSQTSLYPPVPRQTSFSLPATNSQRVRTVTEKSGKGVVGRHSSAICRAVAARQCCRDARRQRVPRPSPELHVRFVAARPQCRVVPPEARVQHSASGELGLLHSSIPAKTVRKTVTIEGGS